MCQTYKSSILRPRVQFLRLLVDISPISPTQDLRSGRPTQDTRATTTLRLDSKRFVQTLARGTSPLTFSTRTLPMIVDISAPTTPSSRRAVGMSQPHDPDNNRREPVGHLRIRTRPVERRLRTRASQGFLLPRRTRARISSGRAGPESTPVGRLLIRLIRVPQSSLVSRGPREMYRKPLRILRAPRPQFDNLMPSTPQPGQPVDPQMAISLESTPRLITMRQGNSVLAPDPLNTHHTVFPEPFRTRSTGVSMQMLM